MRLRVPSLLLAAAFVALGCADRTASAHPSQPLVVANVAGADVAVASNLPVDLSGLQEDERASFFKLIGKIPSACGKAQSLQASLKTDPRCRRSVFAARYIAHLLSMHLLESEVEDHYDERFGPIPKAKIDVSHAPVLGNPNAPVSIVEFSDFQCPHCKRMAPILDRLVDEYRGQVKVYYKAFPLTRMHSDSELAAAAAIAAGKQGKFWPFYEKIFATNQENESMPVLQKIAKDLKLDTKKWMKDLGPARDQVAKDKAEGEALNIDATPTVYIDGRQYHGPHTYEEIKDWVDEELNR
jgi:predicted DsbA family dithiol-disulfide isomerase